MFGFFEKKYDNPALITHINETQERWFAFLDKLEARMAEMCSAAIPELKAVFEQDTDPYKRAHGHMLLGLQGQLSQMRTKVNQVRKDQIVGTLHAGEAAIPSITSNAGRKYHDLLHTFRMACGNRHYIFEEKLNAAYAALKHAAGEQDLEAAYREQLTAFEKIKDDFNCQQCGGNISIPKMFFIATYVNCPFCQTQNTFTPSTEAQMVLHNARSLAEQRTAHLRKAAESCQPKNPELQRQYLRAMIDEWNKIVPDMAAENEKFYERLLKDIANGHY
jgi:rubredoxin